MPHPLCCTSHCVPLQKPTPWASDAYPPEQDLVERIAVVAEENEELAHLTNLLPRVNDWCRELETQAASLRAQLRGTPSLRPVVPSSSLQGKGKEGGGDAASGLEDLAVENLEIRQHIRLRAQLPMLRWVWGGGPACCSRRDRGPEPWTLHRQAT